MANLDLNLIIYAAEMFQRAVWTPASAGDHI